MKTKHDLDIIIFLTEIKESLSFHDRTKAEFYISELKNSLNSKCNQEYRQQNTVWVAQLIEFIRQYFLNNYES